MKIIKAWGPAAVWMTFIFTLSSRPSVQVADEYVWNFLFFKLLHVIEYGILFALILRANLFSFPRRMRNQLFWLSFVMTIAFAASDEIHQTFVPTREGKIRDVIIDGLGATLVWTYLAHISPRLPKRLKRWERSWRII